MSTGLEMSHTSSARNGRQQARQELEVRTPEEAEAILEKMARALTPGPLDLQGLAANLTEGLLSAPSRDPSPGLASHAPEDELRKAQARYRALVEQIPAITFMAPLDGTVSELYVSPQIEQMLGYTASEWLSNPILWYDRLHPDDKNRWQEDFSRTLNAGQHFRSDYRFISRDNRVVWIHGEAKVITDVDGQPLFLQGVAFDITERMEAEEKLHRKNLELARARDQAMDASRAKSAFLANMSHELRTPLHAILGFGEMLTEDARDGGHDSFLPDLEKITDSAKHLVGLINNILDLSKIEAGRMEVYLEDFDVEPMLRDVLTTVLPLIEEKGNHLEVRCQRHLGMMHGDQTKVRQVLLNLLSNAAKFTENGTIALEAQRLSSPEGDHFRLSVKDTGIGIAPHQKEKLFQSFSQGDDSTTRKYGGTGLGLAISQRFCRMMGGTINVHSEVGTGTTFTVELPAHVVPVEEAVTPDVEVPRSDPIEEPPSDEPPILVIDDDPQVVEIVRRLAEREGVRLVSAASGALGLKIAHEVRPLAIVLDMAIPDTDGWTVMTALKADPQLADIPVVVFTLATDSDHAYTPGAADYLTKPIDWGRLSELMKRYRGEKQSPRVLIVDDEPDCRALLERMATQAGWTAVEASNGWGGLKSVSEAPPDLILLDLMMPEMDGFEFLRLLRATHAGRAIPVVVVTAKELTAAESVRLNGSVHKILNKGTFSREDLLGEIGALVRRHARVKARPLAESSLVRDEGTVQVQQLQQELARLRAERDAALTSITPATQEQHAGDDALLRLEEELRATRQQLRENQQAVELLRSEAEEAASYFAEVERLRQELAQVQAERDSLASAPVPSERSSQQGELLLALRQLEKDVETLRARQSPRRGKKKWRHLIEKEKRAEEEKPAPAPVEEKAPWHLTYLDEQGQRHTVACGAEDVCRWAREGRLDLAAARISRDAKGPFEPIGRFDEFRDLIRALLASHRAVRPAPARSPSALAGPLPPASVRAKLAEGSGSTQQAASGRWPEWLTWSLPILLALFAALVLGQILFR